MASWDKLQRSVLLKANVLAASDASTLVSAYLDSDINQSNLQTRAIEFPFAAINDALLHAGGKIVEKIGSNPNSPYRSYFHDQTDSITDGGRIPEVSQAGHPRVGVIGAVYDSSTNEELEMVPRQTVKGADALSLKISPFLYFSDNTRIWHTRDSVIADIVIWEAEVERYWMDATVRGECPFPDSVHDCLVNGALSILFRDKFNSEQADKFAERFIHTLDTL
jgi:hypothetical protein